MRSSSRRKKERNLKIEKIEKESNEECIYKIPKHFSCKEIIQRSYKLSEKGIKDFLTIYVLPVSGSNFPSQLAAISEIHAANLLLNNNRFDNVRQYQPDLLLGASGGAMSSYVGMAGNWSYEGICRTLEHVKPEILCMSWWPPLLRKFLPSWLLWFFQGSMYRNGKGAEDVFELLFNSNTIQRSEIWVNSYDPKRYRSRLFCNRGKSKSIIKEPYTEKLHMKGCSSYEYLKGNLDSIAKTVVASCSIPGLVCKKKYEDSKLVDGGVMFASPLSCMSDEIYDIVRKNKIQLRLFYLASYPMDSSTPTTSSCQGIKSDLLNSLEQIMHSQAIMDRTHSLNILNCLAGNKSVHKRSYKNVDTEKLAQIIHLANSKSHFVLIFYPYRRCELNLPSFTYEQTVHCMDKIKERYMIDLWFIE